MLADGSKSITELRRAMASNLGSMAKHIGTANGGLNFLADSVISIKVQGLLALDGSIEDPNADLWFHMMVRFKRQDGREYSVITKDGTSFHYLYFGNSGGRFSRRDKPIIKDAIKRYVNGDLYRAGCIT